MDYKEKYKQALEKAKERYSACSAPELLEYIFPELKEPEDEHKNWILEYLYDGLRRTDEQFKDEFKAAIQKMADAGSEWDVEKKELKKIESKTLDSDKVIAWLNDQACQGWIEDVEVDKFVAKFKQDF